MKRKYNNNNNINENDDRNRRKIYFICSVVKVLLLTIQLRENPVFLFLQVKTTKPFISIQFQKASTLLFIKNYFQIIMQISFQKKNA